jgi:DNA-binding transcriptional regulator GbsR (MarR family)
MAFEIMRMIRWVPEQKGVSAPELASLLSRSKNNVTQTINQLIEQRLITKGQKIGQRQYYLITGQGRSWLNQMEVTRVERDAELVKDRRAIPGLIERKERELFTFTKLRSRFKDMLSPKIYVDLGKIISAKQREINKIKGKN